MNNRLSHTIKFPPLTDLKELIGMYSNLFTTIGVKSNLQLDGNVTRFQHPIPEENTKLVAEYSNVYQIISSTHSNTPLTLLDIRVVRNQVTFIFSS